MAESGESIRLKDMAREDLRRYQDERRAIEQMQELFAKDLFTDYEFLKEVEE